MEFVHGSGAALPFDNASFDVVINVESAHTFFLQFDDFAHEARRVLKPGGGWESASRARSPGP